MNTIANNKIANHTYTPQPENGIMYPDPKIAIQITPIGRVINVIKVNVLVGIWVIPAIKHNMSSGNIGIRNAIARKLPPLLRSICEYLSVLSIPIIHDTSLYPYNLPIPYDINDPITTPIQQYIPPSIGPNIKLPTIQIIDAGIGRNITCNICIKIYINTPQKPKLLIKFLNSVTFENLVSISNFNKTR